MSIMGMNDDEIAGMSVNLFVCCMFCPYHSYHQARLLAVAIVWLILIMYFAGCT